MNAWHAIVHWFTVNYSSLVTAGILLGIIASSSFLTWLIARHSWKYHEEERLPEISRAKLRDRDETIFRLRQENAHLKRQVETLATNQRAALTMLHQGCGLLHTPEIESDVRLRRAK